MEHRWGQRSSAALSTRVRHGEPRVLAVGRVVNMSISGALIRTALQADVLSCLEVQVDRQWIAGAVIYRSRGYVAVEWLDLAPTAVVRQLERTAHQAHQLASTQALAAA